MHCLGTSGEPAKCASGTSRPSLACENIQSFFVKPLLHRVSNTTTAFKCCPSATDWNCIFMIRYDSVRAAFSAGPRPTSRCCFSIPTMWEDTCQTKACFYVSMIQIPDMDGLLFTVMAHQRQPLFMWPLIWGVASVVGNTAPMVFLIRRSWHRGM